MSPELGAANHITPEKRVAAAALVTAGITVSLAHDIIQEPAIDGGTGETENTAVLVAHIKYAGQTIDVPMRWRGQGGFPASEYPRQPSEMWTGVWVVPMDAQPAMLSYTVTATDRFGRTATFSPFINLAAQITIVE